MLDLISLLGYRADSPFQNNPYLDIHSPGGLIDMSATSQDLMGYSNLGEVKKLKAGRKNPYQFKGDVIREIPINRNPYRMQRGGYSAEDIYNFLFDDDKSEEEQPKNTAPSTEEYEQFQQQQQQLQQNREAFARQQDNALALQLAMQSMEAPLEQETTQRPAFSLSNNSGNPYKAGRYGQEIIGELSNALGYTPQFNSVFRDPQKQQQLIKQGWGVPNSWHLSGDAVDMKPADWNKLSKGQQDFFRKQYDVIYHNNHYHVEPKGPRKDKGGFMKNPFK